MTNSYFPDNWVVIRINSDNTFYKVLAGWSGGYLQGSSWKLNSGITRVEENEHSYSFYGSSGSCYVCGKHSYGLRMNNAHIYNRLQETGKVELLEENTNWLELINENVHCST
jgi:hypothetical protein